MLVMAQNRLISRQQIFWGGRTIWSTLYSKYPLWLTTKFSHVIANSSRQLVIKKKSLAMQDLPLLSTEVWGSNRSRRNYLSLLLWFGRPIVAAGREGPLGSGIRGASGPIMWYALRYSVVAVVSVVCTTYRLHRKVT